MEFLGLGVEDLGFQKGLRVRGVRGLAFWDVGAQGWDLNSKPETLNPKP